MPSSIPSHYHHGQLRDAVLDAARSAVRTEGASQLSLRGLARRIGVTHTAIYRHFPDREAVLAALAIEALHSLAAAERAALQATAVAGDAQLAALVRAYYRWALDDPSRFRLAFAPEFSRKSRVPALRGAADAAEAPALEAIRAHPACATLSPDAVGTLALEVWALVHGFCVLAADGQLSEGALSVSHGSADAIEDVVANAVVRLVGAAGRSPLIA